MTYDTLIVGAGSAGNILAARLSEDAGRRVLLLEAGPDYPEVEALPPDVKYGFGTPSGILAQGHDWGFTGEATAHLPHLPIPRGRLVGGSSAVNAQIFLRGIPDDFAAWADLGNDLWGFDQVLPYYSRVESNLDFGQKPYHGDAGPTPVRRYAAEEWRPDQAAWYQACRAAGFPDCPDANAPGSTGVGPFPLNNLDGIRQSTALTYLQPARTRPNLSVQARTAARRIVVENGRAVGVETLHDGRVEIVRGEEVILCAGAIGSPQLLMLSGIGPADHLHALGLPVVQELPGVGQNLRDHPTTNLHWGLAGDYPIDEGYHWHQVGLRYTAAGSELENDMVVYLGVNPDERFFFVRPTVNLARGSGELRLTSVDPEAHPRLVYRYFDEEVDRQRQREGIRRCIQLVEEYPAFRPLLGPMDQGPGPSLHNDGQLDGWILAHADTGHHSSSTCKMGPPSDPLAVTDQTGRVRGVEGLRIVDASIMPDSVRANINATVMMMAERIADWPQ